MERKERGIEEGWECNREKGYQSKNPSQISENEAHQQIKFHKMNARLVQYQIINSRNPAHRLNKAWVSVGSESPWRIITHTHSWL